MGEPNGNDNAMVHDSEMVDGNEMIHGNEIIKRPEKEVTSLGTLHY